MMHKMAMECMECGKKFRAANPESCPKCGGSDLEVAEPVFYRPAKPVSPVAVAQ